MATAAKKQVGKPATNSAKKPVAKAKPAAKAAAAKTPAKKPVAASAVVKKTPAKSAPAKAKVAPVKPTPAKAAPVKASPAKAKPAAVKVAPAKAKAAAAEASAKAKAKTAVKETVQTKTPAKPKPAAKPAVPTPPVKSMKTPATKAPAGKAAKKHLGAPLTDADILAMSDKDYMNDAQLAFFKAKLEAMRDEILENARETGEHLKENEVFADPNDRATVEEENLLEQRVRDRERKLLKKINASLARIEEGAYGYCLETGDPIGIPRLLARPTAELSIEAQEKHERLEKLYAD